MFYICSIQAKALFCWINTDYCAQLLLHTTAPPPEKSPKHPIYRPPRITKHNTVQQNVIFGSFFKTILVRFKGDEVPLKWEFQF